MNSLIIMVSRIQQGYAIMIKGIMDCCWKALFLTAYYVYVINAHLMALRASDGSNMPRYQSDKASTTSLFCYFVIADLRCV